MSKKPWGYHTRHRGRDDEVRPLGQATFNTVPLIDPDGRPIVAGDLIAGRVYDVDAVSGETIARNRAQRRGKRE